MTRPTITELLGRNPYWSAEANRAAEANPDQLTPKELARLWEDHRIEDPQPLARIYLLKPDE